MQLVKRLGLVRGSDLTLASLAERLAEVHGDRLMVEEPRARRRTFREAAVWVDRAAAGIAGSGVGTGDRVVIATPNGYDQFLLCLAVSRAGGVCVPVNAHMRAEEIDHVVKDSEAALVVRRAEEVTGGREGRAARLSVAWSPPTRPQPTDVAAILYTSGTTGRPKGARLTHRALIGGVAAAALWPSGLRRDEAVLALPIAHVMGFVSVLSFACAGVPVYCLPRFRAGDVLDAIESRHATVFVGVPAMYRMLLEAGAEERDLHSVRAWISGADVMPSELARRFRSMGGAVTLPFAGVTVGDAGFVEGYGMVETGGGVAMRLSPPGFVVPSWVPSPLRGVLGIPIPPNRLRVVDDGGQEVALGSVGELWVKGPGVLEGYHGDAAATSAVRTDDGWLRTGDLVRRGPLGLVSFVGRSKDVIKSGGYSVYASEVERVLEEHPAVAEAAVVGLPDDRLGEIPAAAVRLRPGASAGADELRAWAAERLSRYKAPRQVRIVDTLPRTGTEKVTKNRLVELFAS